MIKSPQRKSSSVLLSSDVHSWDRMFSCILFIFLLAGVIKLLNSILEAGL